MVRNIFILMFIREITAFLRTVKIITITILLITTKINPTIVINLVELRDLEELWRTLNSRSTKTMWNNLTDYWFLDLD